MQPGETVVKLAAVFNDHAVFQREKPVPVWGWTKPLTLVEAELGPVAAATRSGADGRFMLRLPPLSAGGPFELKVTSAGETVVVRDVLIGEVWIASGQSNMQWTLSACSAQGDEAIKAAAKNGLRMFTVPNKALVGRQSDVDAEWLVASPKTAPAFSAVAYHFADKLHATLGVPVGILNTSWGGTIVEAWTSREALIQNPDARAWTECYEAALFSPDFWGGKTEWELSLPADPGNRGEADGWAEPGCCDDDWPGMTLPGNWQSAGHNISGVFWFRREVELPAEWEGKDLSLKIGGVDKQDITYFNGVQVGATGTGFEDTYWNRPRDYEVPGSLVKAGRNVIAVRAYSFVYCGGMNGPAERMNLSRADGQGPAIPLAGDWKYKIEHDFGFVSPAPPMGPGNPNSPYMLFDNMIFPLVPYAIRGAIWYQGESNADKAAQYRGMMTSMIRDWRRVWGQGDFPFIQVQLANFTEAADYQDKSDWARLREAQFMTLSEPMTGMAVIIDVGEAEDIHPHDKRSVGHRLAQWALVETYGQAGVASGPLYTGMTIEKGRVRISFRNVGAGLVARGGDAPSHFMIAGLDRTFHPAAASIDGNAVVVWSKDVPAPVAVRYAWSNNPEGCNLYNQDGFPASPFRTDTW